MDKIGSEKYEFILMIHYFIKTKGTCRKFKKHRQTGAYLSYYIVGIFF